MTRTIFILTLIIASLAPLGAGAQSDELTDDQLALLADIETVLANRDGWAGFAESEQFASVFATTVSGTDASLWGTEETTRRSNSLVDIVNMAASGEIIVQSTVANSDGEADQGEVRAVFAVEGAQVELTRDDETANDVDPAAEEFAVFDLVRLTSFDADERFIIQPELFQHAIDVFDLGVDDDGIQGYEVDLEFATALPDLNFNIDAFVSRFNGVVELRALTDAIMQNAVVTLSFAVDQETGQLIESGLFIDLRAEIEGDNVVAVEAGDGIFSLEYGQQHQFLYFDVTTQAEPADDE